VILSIPKPPRGVAEADHKEMECVVPLKHVLKTGIMEPYPSALILNLNKIAGRSER